MIVLKTFSLYNNKLLQLPLAWLTGLLCFWQCGMYLTFHYFPIKIALIAVAPPMFYSLWGSQKIFLVDCVMQLSLRQHYSTKQEHYKWFIIKVRLLSQHVLEKEQWPLPCEHLCIPSMGWHTTLSGLWGSLQNFR